MKEIRPPGPAPGQGFSPWIRIRKRESHQAGGAPFFSVSILAQKEKSFVPFKVSPRSRTTPASTSLRSEKTRKMSLRGE